MKVYHRVFLILLCVVVADCSYYMGGKGDGSFFTPIALVAKYTSLISLIYFARKSEWRKNIPSSFYVVFILFLLWSVITIVRGGFEAKNYWDWKFLFFNSSLFLLVPLSFFLGKDAFLVRLNIYGIIKYLLPYGLLLIPVSMLTTMQLYPRIMMPVTVILLFVPYLKPKHKFLVLFVAFCSALMAVGFRTNLLKISMSIGILAMYYFRYYIQVFWMKLMFVVLFATPLVLLFLAVYSQFNIFSNASENEKYKITSGNGEEESLTADTRTLLYLDVFATMEANNSWFMGEGSVGKYKTDSFDNLVGGAGRYGTEVGMLNTLLFSGIIGVVLYGVLLFLASFYGLFFSNNYLSKMLGLLIAGRWVIFFLEEFTEFDINFYFLWIIIGLTVSAKFRSLSDFEIKKFLNFK